MADDKKTIVERAKEFMQRPDYPQQLRKNAARSYHPDALPPPLKKSGEEIMKRINVVCDDLEKGKGR
jgi:hypothetical protein